MVPFDAEIDLQSLFCGLSDVKLAARIRLFGLQITPRMRWVMRQSVVDAAFD